MDWPSFAWGIAAGVWIVWAIDFDAYWRGR